MSFESLVTELLKVRKSAVFTKLIFPNAGLDYHPWSHEEGGASIARSGARDICLANGYRIGLCLPAAPHRLRTPVGELLLRNHTFLKVSFERLVAELLKGRKSALFTGSIFPNAGLDYHPWSHQEGLLSTEGSRPARTPESGKKLKGI